MPKGNRIADPQQKENIPLQPKCVPEYDNGKVNTKLRKESIPTMRSSVKGSFDSVLNSSNGIRIVEKKFVKECPILYKRPKKAPGRFF